MALMTRRSGAGYVVEKITGSMSAKPALLAKSRVILLDQGEEMAMDVGGVEMMPLQRQVPQHLVEKLELRLQKC